MTHIYQHIYPNLLGEMFQCKAMGRMLKELKKGPVTMPELCRTLGIRIPIGNMALNKLRAEGHTILNTGSKCGPGGHPGLMTLEEEATQ